MDRAKILVVDDESRMRKLVRDFLVREGYNVLEAEDGVEAMDIFYEEKDISLLILDVMMPRMDGWQVCREIRESSKVPIIMLTARSEERDELQGFDLGVDEYISKPFSPKILVARVNAILRRTLGSDAGEDTFLDAYLEEGFKDTESFTFAIRKGLSGQVILSDNCMMADVELVRKEAHGE